MAVKWNATNIISRNDVFTMLKLIYASRLSVYQREGREVYSGIFQETILQLEKMEHVLEQIASRAAPTREEFKEYVKEGDQDQIEDTIKFYQDLRMDSQLHKLQRNHRYSINVNSFYKRLFGKDSLFLTMPGDVAWSSKKFPEQEVFDFAEMLQEHLKKQQAKIRQKVDTALTTYCREAENLNQLLRINKQLYVTCFDIEITSRMDNWKDEIQRYLTSPDANAIDFEVSLKQVLDLCAYYLTLEVNENEGFKIFLVVLQSKAEKSHPNALSLERTLKHHFSPIEKSPFPFDITVGDISKSIQKKCHLTAAGCIDSPTSLRQFQYWVLGYLYFRGLYLEPCFDSYDETIIEYYFGRKVLKEISLAEPIAAVVSPVPRIKSPPKKPKAHRLFKQIDLSTQHKKIWSDSHLPSSAKTYLKLIELLYNEQSALGVMQYSESILNGMLYIEKFMQTILHYPALAFDANHDFEQIQKNPSRYMTQVAKQYLEIARALENPDPLLATTVKSIGSALVGSFFKSYLGRYSTNSLFQWLINDRGVEPFNKLLTYFKNAGKQQYSSTIETSKRNTIAKNRVEAYKYLREKLKHDVLALRFMFSCKVVENKDYDQNAFRALITDFIKNIKRRPKAIGAELLGYIGTYRYKEGLAVDVVLLFHAGDVDGVNPDIAKVIQQYWLSYFVEKKKNIEKQKLKTKEVADATTSTSSFPHLTYFEGTQLVAEQHPVMASIHQLNAMGLIINSYNRSLKNLFIKSMADYFSGYCLIWPQGPGESSGSSGFFKGSLSRNKKPETSEKQAKATKPVQTEDSKQ